MARFCHHFLFTSPLGMTKHLRVFRALRDESRKATGDFPRERYEEEVYGQQNSSATTKSKVEVCWVGVCVCVCGGGCLTLPWPGQVTQWLQSGGRSSWRIGGEEEGEDLFQRPRAPGCEGNLAATPVTPWISEADSTDLAGEAVSPSTLTGPCASPLPPQKLQGLGRRGQPSLIEERATRWPWTYE